METDIPRPVHRRARRGHRRRGEARLHRDDDARHPLPAPRVPAIVGKTHEDGSTLFSRFGELDVDAVTRGLADRPDATTGSPRRRGGSMRTVTATSASTCHWRCARPTSAPAARTTAPPRSGPTPCRRRDRLSRHGSVDGPTPGGRCHRRHADGWRGCSVDRDGTVPGATPLRAEHRRRHVRALRLTGVCEPRSRPAPTSPTSSCTTGPSR